jgi:hypothetical protein
LTLLHIALPLSKKVMIAHHRTRVTIQVAHSVSLLGRYQVNLVSIFGRRLY